MKYKDLLKFFFQECPEVVSDMGNSDHHFDKDNLNPWHMEGTVLTHTLMVVREAEIRNVNKMVQLGCLFHDYGKSDCRGVNPETKRVNYFGHEGYSAIKSIYYLKKLSDFIPEGLSKNEIVHIVKLVALHTEPFRFSKPEVSEEKFQHIPKENREQAIKREYNKKVDKIFAKLVKTYGYEKRLLADLLELSICDHQGRFMDEDNISDNSENTAFRVELINKLLEYPMPKKEKKEGPRIIIPVGIPCSGKSYWVKNFLKENSDFEYICRDELIMELHPANSYNESYALANKDEQKSVEKEFYKRIKESIKKGKNIIVDQTNISRKRRNSILAHIPEAYSKESVVFLTDLPTIEKRNLEREGKFIKKESFDMMAKAFSPPLIGEFDSIEWIIN